MLAIELTTNDLRRTTNDQRLATYIRRHHHRRRRMWAHVCGTGRQTGEADVGLGAQRPAGSQDPDFGRWPLQLYKHPYVGKEFRVGRPAICSAGIRTVDRRPYDCVFPAPWYTGKRKNTGPTLPPK